MTDKNAGPKYVIAPEGCKSWLTPGKKYEVLDWETPNKRFGGFFRTTADNGENIYTSLRENGHLNGGDWITPDDEAPSPSVPEAAPQPDGEVHFVADDERRFVAAVAAMQGMIAFGLNDTDEVVANQSVALADALIAALAVKKGSGVMAEANVSVLKSAA
jgi:hypothetical protein